MTFFDICFLVALSCSKIYLLPFCAGLALVLISTHAWELTGKRYLWAFFLTGWVFLFGSLAGWSLYSESKVVLRAYSVYRQTPEVYAITEYILEQRETKEKANED